MLGKMGGSQSKTNSTAAANVKGMPPSVNLFPPGQIYDFYLYLDDSVSFQTFKQILKQISN